MTRKAQLIDAKKRSILKKNRDSSAVDELRWRNARASQEAMHIP